ncbi:MAG: SCO family protein [Chloroflexota bacterium]|nr:MAG: SCO family protein [Chloroflexota bacterium]
MTTPSARSYSRLALSIGTVLAALFAVAIATIASAWIESMMQMPGTALDGAPSPEFSLRDHRGARFALSDTRGKPTIVTFLYANCPDVCRLTAAGLRQTLDLLGDQADDVAIVAVSTDPNGDSPAATRQFLSRQGLSDRMRYLVGTYDELAPVWQAYHIYAGDRRDGLEAHTDAIYVLDRDGGQRAFLRSDFDPDELASALRKLLG